jgi:OOP family OmpA-OmpF porin
MIVMKTAALSAFTALLLASPLVAVSQTMEEGAYQTLPSFDNRWYISPFAAYTWADEDRGTDDGAGFGFAVGKPINQWLNLELRATYTDLSSENPADLSSSQIQDRLNNIANSGFPGDGDFRVGDIALDGLFFLNRGAVQPFLLAGLGAINDDFGCDRTPINFALGCQSDNSWSFMAEAGGGILVPMGDNLSLRLDGRYRYDDNSGDTRNASDFGDWLVTAGIYIPIGAKYQPATVTRTFELSADALFGFNKDNLSPTGVNTISNFARDLGDKANYTDVRVAGHTDPIGSDSFNQDLSDRRANTVRDQLVTEGVPSDRVSAQGFGESQLKVTEADCAGAKSRAALIECFQPNRRVEVTVEGMKAK